MSILAKQTGAIVLGSINLALIIWAVMRYRRRQTVPTEYFWLWLASVVVAALQVGLGAWFVLVEGRVATGRHLFYGLVVAAGALAQALLLPAVPLSQRYKARPLIYAFWALVVVLASVRSWLTG